MVANAIEKSVAIHVETTFASEAAIDYDTLVSPEGLLAVTEVQDEGLVRAYIENENITPRAADVHPKIRGLRSGATAQISSYIYGARSGHAADGAQAARDLLDIVLQSALGGEYRGYREGLTGGSATNPEFDDTTNILPWTWGYFWDLSTSTGYFRLIETIVDEHEVIMAAGHTLPFTPVAGDIMYATRVHYPDWAIGEDPTHASHRTLAMMFKGRHAEDYYDLRGVKPDLQFGAIEQGTPTKLSMPLKLAYFLHNEITLPGPDLLQALQGSPGMVVGSGQRTTCWMSAADALLATQQFWGAMQPSVAIEHAGIMGPNGTEGVHGWGLAENSYKGGGIDVSVPFDRDWRVAAEAGTQYHMLIQVGNAITDGVWGLYFPCLTFDEDAKPAADNSKRRQSDLKFRARERQGVDTSLFTATERERTLAKFQILRLG